MTTALSLFDDLIGQTESTSAIYRNCISNSIPVDASDLLRWQWVQSVSAMDRYIHDIVRIGIIEMFQGKRQTTPKYEDLPIRMSLHAQLKLSGDVFSLNEEITRKHSQYSYQSPDKIADALSFVWGTKDKWEYIAQNLSLFKVVAKDTRIRLNNIVIRRNQIVHEGDCQNTTMGLIRQEICEEDVKEVITFIKEVCHAIYLCVK